MTKKQNEKQEKEKDEVEKQEEKVETELDAVDNAIAELESKYKRAVADYQNLEKRVTDQRREIILSANRDLLLRLLPVLDTLELALKHEKNQTIQVSVNQFLDILKSEGVTKIDTTGKTFDPYLMEVIETVEGDDGKVVEEVRAGYQLYDKVLRVAQVKVGKKN